jgi:hypothetical protein
MQMLVVKAKVYFLEYIGWHEQRTEEFVPKKVTMFEFLTNHDYSSMMAHNVCECEHVIED